MTTGAFLALGLLFKGWSLGPDHLNWLKLLEMGERRGLKGRMKRSHHGLLAHHRKWLVLRLEGDADHVGVGVLGEP